jgi:hypothetical protein
VIIVLDRERVIESRLDPTGKGGGVDVRPLREALKGMLKGRFPLDEYPSAAVKGVKGFVIRRWYPDGGQAENE